jgi:hypothetical protein
MKLRLISFTRIEDTGAIAKQNDGKAHKKTNV